MDGEVTDSAAQSDTETDSEDVKTDADTCEPTSAEEPTSNQLYQNTQSSVDDAGPTRWYHCVNVVLGAVVMCAVGAIYSWYLYTLHENMLWFSHILEVEREISFRTEAGLYYSYYKQLVGAHTFAQGVWDLTRDNVTENWRTINILNRFNIYQEVFLAGLYRSLPLISVHLPPIFFYVHAIFVLHGVYLMALYALSWLLTGSWVAGLLTSAFYLCNRSHTTRVDFTAPLRESFALPLYSMQLLMVTLFLRKSTSVKYEKLQLLVVFLATSNFTITWQFAQFILLLQTSALYLTAILGLVEIRKVQKLLLCSMASILLVGFLQFGNRMLLGSLALSFLLAAYTLLAIMSDRSQTVGLFHNFWRVCARSVSVLGLTLLINCCTKASLRIEDDQHIFRFLQVKFGLSTEWDFDSHLYICHSAFDFMSWSVVRDLTRGLVLPIYAVTVLGLMLATLAAVLKKWTEVPDEEVPCFKHEKDPPSTESSFMRARPELVFHMIHGALIGFMAVMVTRMKYVWVPQACVLAAYGIALPGLWRTLLATTSNTIIQAARISALLLTLALLMTRSLPSIRQELDVLQEFYDPDTVELMDWINYYTPPDAAFSGSMQLMAGVKLCTGRTLTNHPHYEDKQVRERTFKLLQVYGRRSVEEVYRIHSTMGTDYIILEDSICLARGPQGCRLKDILDTANGHIPDYVAGGDGNGEHTMQTPRFCQAIKDQTPEQLKYFMKVFHNRTFRIYKVMDNEPDEYQI